MLTLWKEVITNQDSILKSRGNTLPTKVHLVKIFPVVHWFFQWSCIDVRVGLWRKLSAKELMLLNCGVGEDSCESLDCKEIQPVLPKGDLSWVFIGSFSFTDVEAVTPILWPPDAKSWLIGKDPDAGKDWGQEEKGMTEDEMVGWHHQLDGHGFGWTPGVGDGQGGLVCCGFMESQSQTRLSNWTEPRLSGLGWYLFPPFTV